MGVAMVSCAFFWHCCEKIKTKGLALFLVTVEEEGSTWYCSLQQLGNDTVKTSRNPHWAGSRILYWEVRMLEKGIDKVYAYS